jgi:hypothetical protein
VSENPESYGENFPDKEGPQAESTVLERADSETAAEQNESTEADRFRVIRQQSKVDKKTTFRGAE